MCRTNFNMKGWDLKFNKEKNRPISVWKNLTIFGENNRPRWFYLIILITFLPLYRSISFHWLIWFDLGAIKIVQSSRSPNWCCLHHFPPWSQLFFIFNPFHAPIVKTRSISLISLHFHPQAPIFLSQLPSTRDLYSIPQLFHIPFSKNSCILPYFFEISVFKWFLMWLNFHRMTPSM